MDDDLFILRLAVAEEWDKAEEAIKIAEQVNDKVVSPAIYELRYAGRKLIEASRLEREEPQKAAAVLKDARLDCLRARHDAIDAATSKVVKHLDLAVRKLGAAAVLASFPQWSDTYRELSAIRTKIAESRSDRNNRDSTYLHIQTFDLPKVVKLYQEFKAMEPALIRDARWARAWFVGSVIFGVIGVLSSLFSIFT